MEDNKNSKQVCRICTDTTPMNPVKLVWNPPQGQDPQTTPASPLTLWTARSQALWKTTSLKSTEQGLNNQHQQQGLPGWLSSLTQKGGF